MPDSPASRQAAPTVEHDEDVSTTGNGAPARRASDERASSPVVARP